MARIQYEFRDLNKVHRDAIAQYYRLVTVNSTRQTICSKPTATYVYTTNCTLTKEKV